MFLFEFRCSDHAPYTVEFVYVISDTIQNAQKRVPKPYSEWGVLGTGKISKLSPQWDGYGG